MQGQMFYSNVPINQSDRIYLERPRLDRILEQAIKRPIVSVTAGAGYGKTHAVYSFLRKYEFMTAWIQMSERDNIGGRFWENFTGAVALLSLKTAEQLAALGFPETIRRFERYIKIPQESILPDRKYVFVYDDFHLIRDEKVLRFIEHSITTPFPNITSILISRNEPPIDTERLSAGGMLTRITEEDIRFTLDETAAFFELQQITCSAETAASVYRDTEGWAFATYLAALSLNRAGAEYVNQGMRGNIFRLIESEIMAAIDEEPRKFLIKLSLIDHLAPDLLKELEGEQNLLGQLDSIGSFLQFDTYLNAYKIHPLFLEYLEEKQHELGEKEKQAAYLIAAMWCMENGKKIDAITYFEKAGDYNKLAEAVSRTLPFAMPDPIAQILLSVYERAPAEVFDQNPLIYVLYTRLLIALGFFERADAELRKIIAKLKVLDPTELNYRALSDCYINQALCRYLASMYTRDYSFADNFVELSYYITLPYNRIKSPLTVASMGSYVCRVNNREKGEMEKLFEALDKTVPCFAMVVGGCTWGLNDLARAEFAFFRFDLEEAEHHALRALKKARQQSQYEIENRALFFLLRIFLAHGEAASVSDTVKQLEAQLDIPDYVNRNIFHDIVSGWFYVQIGQSGRIASWLKNDFEESDLSSVMHGFEALVKARYHLAEKHFAAVMAALESRNDNNGAPSFLIGQVETKALEAICRYQLKDIEGAVEALRLAYELSESNKLFMPFIELGKDMRALINAIYSNDNTKINRQWLEKIRNGASAYAKKLLTVARQYRPPDTESKTSTGDGTLLSRREAEVITGLSRGLTRVEIAENASISINTVKSVIRSVYNKLGAVNQADAVRIAAALGICK